MIFTNCESVATKYRFYCKMPSGITKELFGKTDDLKEVYKFTQVNKNGLVLEIINYGVIIVGIKCPDKNGKLDDITLGFDDFAGYYKHNEPHFGSTIGRVCNRIANGQFEIDGHTYHVTVNDPPNCLHGGCRGFDKYVWDYKINEDSITFSRTSIDCEEGFPGKLDIQVTYFLNDDNEIHFNVSATTDKPTPINITNHSYFNLAGQVDKDVLEQVAVIDAEYYLPTNKFQIPTGEIVSVKDAPAFDFLVPKTFGRDLDSTPNKGYDNNYCLPSADFTQLAARVYARNSGRFLEISTSQPGIQLYTANSLDGDLVGKNGIAYKKYAAFCLETQNFPDAINHKNFPNSVLRPGQTYEQTTKYKLGVQQ